MLAAPSLTTAQLVLIAESSYEVLRSYSELLGEDPKPAWNELPAWKRANTIVAVAAVLEQRVTPEAQHERWRESKQREGWTYGERRDAVARRHPCMRRYDELPVAQQAKAVLCHAMCNKMASMIRAGFLEVW